PADPPEARALVEPAALRADRAGRRLPPAGLRLTLRAPRPASFMNGTPPRRASCTMRVLGSVRARDGAPAAAEDGFTAVPKTRMVRSARPPLRSNVQE